MSHWVFDAMGDLRQYIPKLPKRRAKLGKPPKPTVENIAKEEAQLEQEAQQAAQPPVQQQPPQVVPVQPVVQPQPAAVVQPVQPQPTAVVQPQPEQQAQVTAEQLLIEIYNRQIATEEKIGVLIELVKNLSELLRLMAQKKE